MDTACDILDLNAIHMLKYRTRKKIDWAAIVMMLKPAKLPKGLFFAANK